MSIKRTKQRSSGSSRRDDSAGSASAKPPESQKSWNEYTDGQPDTAFVPYSLGAHFTAGTLIEHAKFGRGAVVSDAGSFVLVLFADGPKKLGHVPG